MFSYVVNVIISPVQWLRHQEEDSNVAVAKDTRRARHPGVQHHGTRTEAGNALRRNRR